MNYNIFDRIVPAMTSLTRVTEICKLLLSQASEDMRETLFPMLLPLLGAHISGTEFQYHNLIWKVFCGQMANLVTNSSYNKGKLSYLVETICPTGGSECRKFADPSSLHMHTPGYRKCRLWRQVEL